MLPLPLRVRCAIALASLSIWKIRPLNFSTLQRPLESTSRSKVPGLATFAAAPGPSNVIDGTDDFAVDFRKDFGGKNVSKFCFSIQTVDCLEVLGEFQGVFCLQSLLLAVTVTFSIENAISLNAPAPSPRSSASSVRIP